MSEKILNTVDMCFLPSRGSLYPESSPLYNKEYVEFRDMTSVEEDILANKILLKRGVAFNKILQNVLVDKSINVMEMTMADRRALLIRLRANSYGPEYKFTVRCPECDRRQEVVVDLNVELENAIKYVKSVEQTLIDFEKYKLERTSHNTFKFVTPKDNWEIEFRIGNGNDEYELFKEEERRKKNKEIEEFSDGLVLSSLKRFVVSINNNRDPKYIQEQIRKIKAYDHYVLRMLFHETSCEFDLNTVFECENEDCGYSEKIVVPMTSNFFRPSE